MGRVDHGFAGRMSSPLTYKEWHLIISRSEISKGIWRFMLEGNFPEISQPVGFLKEFCVSLPRAHREPHQRPHITSTDVLLGVWNVPCKGQR